METCRGQETCQQVVMIGSTHANTLTLTLCNSLDIASPSQLEAAMLHTDKIVSTALITSLGEILTYAS